MQIRNVDLIEASFKDVVKFGDPFIIRFYERFFSKSPEIAPLFTHGSVRQQRQKLMFALVMIIENLRDPALIRYLIDLGQIHIHQYGVKPEYAPLFRDALIETFTEFLGENFTPDMQQAWVDTYDVITERMFQVT